MTCLLTCYRNPLLCCCCCCCCTTKTTAACASASASAGRKRDWFAVDDAVRVLRCHKPVQATYFQALRDGCLASNGSPLAGTISGDLSPGYSISQSSVSGIR